MGSDGRMRRGPWIGLALSKISFMDLDLPLSPSLTHGTLPHIKSKSSPSHTRKPMKLTH